MGGISSKTFSEMIEEDDNDGAVGTPQKPHRVMEQWQDPRSPTVDITRTPIQVEKTPDMVIDPRSPTTGINRTPIHSYMVEPKTAMTLNGHQEELDVTHVDDEPDPSSSDSRLDEVEPLNLDDIRDLDLKLESDETEAEALVGPEFKSEEKEPRKTTEPRNIMQSFSPSKSVNTKVVFHSHTNQDLNMPPDGKKTGRSPLKLIDSSPRSQAKYDTNSPRAIVQRKQASKLGILQNPAKRKFNLGSPTKYNQLKEHDKEN